MPSTSLDDVRNKVNDKIELYLSSKESARKESSFKMLLDILDTVEGRALFKKDSEIEGKIEALSRDLWKVGNQSDYKIWGRLYDLKQENVNFQLFFTTSLVNSGNMDEIKSFLRSDYLISEAPKIIEQVEAMAKASEMWDYATLFLSRNGIYSGMIYQKYAEHSTPVFTKIVVENLKKSGKEKYVEEFMAILSTINPDDIESAILYMETLLNSQKLQVLKVNLQSLDFNAVKDESLLERILKLCFESGLYDDVISLSTRILSLSPGNQVAMELRMKAMGILGRDEDVVDIFTKNEATIEKNEENLSVFFASAYNINSYSYPLTLIDNLDHKLSDKIPIKIWEVKFLLLSGNNAKAEKVAEKIPMDNLNDPEILKIKALLRKDTGKGNEFIISAKKYIQANPYDTKFIKDFARKLTVSGNYGEVISLFKSDVSVRDDNEFRNIYIKALLKNGQIESAGNEIKASGIENMEYDVFSTILTGCRSDKTFADLSHSIGNDPDKIQSLYRVIRGILFNNSLDRKEFQILKGVMKSDIIGVLELVYEDGTSSGTPPGSEMERRVKSILDGTSNDEDLPEFIYPSVAHNIISGNLDRSKSLLAKYEWNNDPFVNYYRSLISEREGNDKDAKKYIENAKNEFGSNIIVAQYLRKFNVQLSINEIVKILETISRNGGLYLVDFGPIEERIMSSDEDVIGNIVDMIEYSPLKSISSLRLLRDISESKNKQEEAVEIDRIIFEDPLRNSEDVMKYALRLKALNMIDEMETLVSKVHNDLLPAENYAIFGDFFLSISDYSSAIYYYEKAMESGSSIERCKGLIDALIKEKKFDQALKYTVNLKISTPYEVKVYAESNKPDELVRIIRKLDLRKESDVKGFEIILEDYWNNRYIRKALLEVFSQHPSEELAIKIAGLLIDERDIEGALSILRRTIKEKVQTGKALAYTIDLLCEYGKFEEAHENAIKYFKSKESIERKRRIFYTLTANLVKYGYDEEVVRLYHEFGSLMDVDSSIPVIKALIKEEYFDSAEKILSKFQGQFASKDIFDELWNLLRKNWDFSEIVYYSGEYLKACFKRGRALDKREAVALGGVPVSSVDDVFEFINSQTNLSLFNQSYLEDESMKVIFVMYKKLKIERMETISLADVFYTTGFKDLKKAKAIYDYIQAQRMDNHPIYVEKNSQLLNMAGICIRENIPMNPITYSLRFNIGIRKAMELNAFINNIDRVNN